MQTKPIFVGLAAGALVLVIAAAAFFTGLYFGQRGFVAGLQSQQNGPAGFPQGQFGQSQQDGQFQNGGNSPNGSPQTGPNAGQPSQNGFNPAGGPPGAPSWPPDSLGRILSIDANQIVLGTQFGNVTVTISSSTKFLDPQGNAISVNDLQVGDMVAVFDQGTAARVMHLPPHPVAP